jgi:tetratricopeptide (TPR) repeat protein
VPVLRIAVLLTVVLIAGCAVVPQDCQPSDALRPGPLFVNHRASCDQAIALGGSDDVQAYACRTRARTWSLPSEATQALGDADEAIRLQPADPEGYVVRAAINRTLGNRDPAIADLTTALARSGVARGTWPYTDRSDIHWDRGELYAAAGLRDQAIADYGEILRRPPRTFDWQYAHALDHHAELSLRLGRLDDAECDYDEILRHDPEDAWALWARGTIKAHRGDTRGADADVAAARSLDPQIEQWGWEVGVYPTGPLPPTTSRVWLRPRSAAPAL